jgi:hypothetical protein
LWFKGYGIAGVIKDTTVELFNADATGHNGAAIDFDGAPGQRMDNWVIEGNNIGVISPAPAMDGIRVNHADSMKVSQNHWNIQAGKVAVRMKSNAYGTSLGLPWSGATGNAPGYVNEGDVGINFPLVAFGSTGFAYQDGTVAINGPFRSNEPNDTLYTGVLLSNAGVETARLVQLGASWSEVTRRGDLEIYNESATGDLSLGTNSIERLKIDKDGLVTFTEDVTVKSLALSQYPTWVAPALAGLWTDLGSGNANAGYTKSAGRVCLRGVVTGGTGTIFTLPVGYRPSETLNFPVVSNSAFGHISITSAGVVSMVIGSSTWLSLDNISFAIGQ